MKRMLSMLLSLALLLTSLGAMSMTASASGKGDVNNDDTVTTSDVRLMMNLCIGTTAPTQKQLWWGDYDLDGAITSTDARSLLQRILVSDSADAIDYANVTQCNVFGERSVSVIGDSISYGSGSGGNLSENSYVGLIRKAVNAETGCDNYGFMSVRAQTWEADASIRSYGIHDWPTMVGDWVEERNQAYLMWDGFTATGKWNYMDFHMRDIYSYPYFCIYYQVGPDRGSFSAGSIEEDGGHDQTTIDGSGPVFDCYAASEGVRRTPFYRMSDFNDQTIRIAVQSEGKRVTITGIGYYYDITDTAVTVNDFAAGGLQLAGEGTQETGVNTDVLGVAAKADTLIFSLGYNDSHFTNSRELFTQKINFLIDQVNQNNTHLIVNDMCWYIPSFTGITMNEETIRWYKSELKRFARETGGIYLDQQAIHGDTILGTVTDGAHPNATGHALIANTILEAMGLR